MAGKRPKPEEIVSKLRQVEVLQGQGLSIADAVRQIGVTRSVRNSVYRPPARFQLDRPQPPMGEKRSSNIMANWFTAVSHPLTVLAVFSCPRIAR